MCCCAKQDDAQVLLLRADFSMDHVHFANEDQQCNGQECRIQPKEECPNPHSGWGHKESGGQHQKAWRFEAFGSCDFSVEWGGPRLDGGLGLEQGALAWKLL